jgi:phosphosulfolactate synthase (CoM biosynthesis protein A)
VYFDQATAALPFLRLNDRSRKPRTSAITEVRGPYYSTIGPAYLDDLLTVAGPYVDWLKIPGPGIALLPASALAAIVETCRAHEVKVSAGGLIEFVVTRGPGAVDAYFDALVDLGFDVVEVSAGFLAMSTPDYLRLVERAKQTGLSVKAEVGIQFGAGGTSSAATLSAEGTTSTSWAISRAKQALAAGADMIVLESEGVTESVTSWRTDVPAAFVAELGMERMMFEAAEPAVFEWYIKNYGPEVNLFVDHSQALHLESLRSGVWGPSSLFGRVVTYSGDSTAPSTAQGT